MRSSNGYFDRTVIATTTKPTSKNNGNDLMNKLTEEHI